MNSPKTSWFGVSTGWLYGNGVFSLREQAGILRAAGANAVEVCLGGWSMEDRRMLSLSVEKDETPSILGFSYRSLHLPNVDGQEQARQILMAQWAVSRCAAAVALTHPMKIGNDYPMECYERMITIGVPLAIENMDSRKPDGFKVEELRRLATVVGCRFVLDVQHAYEHDPTMAYAGDLLESMKGQLAHLHVSGENPNASKETGGDIHSLVHKATNAKRIVEFLGRVLAARKVPLILEGEYTKAEELQKEIKFLTRELGL